MRPANTNNVVFRLFASCIAVQGASRSTICDLQRNAIHLIPNALYDILTRHRDRTLEEIRGIYGNEHDDTIDSYFEFLLKNELGFWCDEPEAFPDLDLTWDRPEVITNAVIDIDSQSDHDFQSIFSQLDDLGCRFVQIRFFSRWPLADIESKVLGPTSFGGLRGIELLLAEDPQWREGELDDFCQRNTRIVAIMVHSSSSLRRERLEHSGITAFFSTDRIDSAAHCGQIHPDYFAPTLACFTEAQKHNTCLNRKISIDARGEIKNCPSFPISYGNAKTRSLHSAVACQSFKDLWYINKDQIEVCKDCEFRYVCTDCRAFIKHPANKLSKPSKCSYDPYTARWGRVEPYSSPQQASPV